MRAMSYRLALMAAAAVAATIFVGGPIQGRIAGLTVPEWPNTYGHFLLPSPLGPIAAGRLWELLRLVVAIAAGGATLGLAWRIFRVETRMWVRRAALVAAAPVLLEALLAIGGLTGPPVMTAAAMLHGTMAQIALGAIVAIATGTSESWTDEPARARDAGRPDLRRLATATVLVILTQVVLGAITRHADAGLAIPDFPTIFGGWLPPLSDERLAAANRDLRENGLIWRNGLGEVGAWQIVINLLHRLGALVSAVMVVWTALRVRRAHGERGELLTPAHALLFLLLVQITLGILTILTRRQIEVASAHALFGGLTLAAGIVLALRARHLLAGGATVDPAVPSIPDEVHV